MTLKNNFSKKFVLATLLVLIALSGGAFALWRNNQKNTVPQSETTSIGQPPTYTTETEGQEIEVPEDVPKDSIKNYELVTENEQFKIRKLDDTYTITLYAIINRPDQYDYYKDQLRDYKQNALNYLKHNNINPDKVNIIYEPEEAKDL